MEMLPIQNKGVGFRKTEALLEEVNEIAYRDRKEPHSSSLPHHAAYGSVLRGSADQASSAPRERKPK